jgi:hypothetical protein
MKSLNLKPMPRKIAQCAMPLEVAARAQHGRLAGERAIFPSEKSMMARSRSSRSWLP